MSFCLKKCLIKMYIFLISLQSVSNSRRSFVAPPPNRFLRKKTVIFKTTELLAANRTLRDAAKRVATLVAHDNCKKREKK